MSSPGTFEQIYAKVVRAEQHIQEFHLVLQAYLDTYPYRVGIEEQPDGVNGTYYVFDIKPTPATLAVIASDVIQNLRSALDNLAYRLVLDAHAGAKPSWKVYFPISKTASDYKGTRGGCIKGVRQDIIDAIDATEPYNGGKGHGFWQLQHLSNLGKHEIPLVAASYNTGVDVSVDLMHQMRKAIGREIRIPSIFLRPGGELRPLKVGDVLFRGPAHPEVAQNRQFTFDVAIDAPNVIGPEPAIVTFKNLSNLVGGTLRSFERFF